MVHFSRRAYVPRQDFSAVRGHPPSLTANSFGCASVRPHLPHLRGWVLSARNAVSTLALRHARLRVGESGRRLVRPPAKPPSRGRGDYLRTGDGGCKRLDFDLQAPPLQDLRSHLREMRKPPFRTTFTPSGTRKASRLARATVHRNVWQSPFLNARRAGRSGT